jgi:predicted methyltransferase
MLFVGCQGARTLRILTLVERERDLWQRPADILRALDLGQGSVVVDLGCGSGYFALKLSPMVGRQGVVLAEDVRFEPLAFLWIRALMQHAHNVRAIHGGSLDPRLPPTVVDAVLIANTYHELSQPQPVIDAVFHAMRSGGRLVVVDRGPRADGAMPRAALAGRHELSPEVVDGEIREAGFETVSRQGRFIDRPGDDHVWWLIVARKP